MKTKNSTYTHTFTLLSQDGRELQWCATAHLEIRGQLWPAQAVLRADLRWDIPSERSACGHSYPVPTGCEPLLDVWNSLPADVKYPQKCMAYYTVTGDSAATLLDACEARIATAVQAVAAACAAQRTAVRERLAAIHRGMDC